MACAGAERFVGGDRRRAWWPNHERRWGLQSRGSTSRGCKRQVLAYGRGGHGARRGGAAATTPRRSTASCRPWPRHPPALSERGAKSLFGGDVDVVDRARTPPDSPSARAQTAPRRERCRGCGIRRRGLVFRPPGSSPRRGARAARRWRRRALHLHERPSTSPAASCYPPSIFWSTRPLRPARPSVYGLYANVFTMLPLLLVAGLAATEIRRRAVVGGRVGCSSHPEGECRACPARRSLLQRPARRWARPSRRRDAGGGAPGGGGVHRGARRCEPRRHPTVAAAR